MLHHIFIGAFTLKYHYASDIGLLILILIIPKEYTVYFPIDP